MNELISKANNQKLVVQKVVNTHSMGSIVYLSQNCPNWPILKRNKNLTPFFNEIQLVGLTFEHVEVWPEVVVGYNWISLWNSLCELRTPKEPKSIWLLITLWVAKQTI